MKCAICNQDFDCAPVQIGVLPVRFVFPCVCGVCNDSDGVVARSRRDPTFIGVMVGGVCQWMSESSLAVYPTESERAWESWHNPVVGA